jgi:hypothetical protein
MYYWPAWVGDLNCDHVDDLILLARNLDPLQQDWQGVYLLLGRAVQFGDGYDAFLPTGELRPHAILVEDLGGDGRLDLLLYTALDEGGDPVETESAHLIAFTGRPELEFEREGERAVPEVLEPPFFGVDHNSFAFLAGADLDADSDRDLILSSGSWVVLFELASWGAEDPVATAVDFDLGFTWFGPQIGIYPRGDGSGDDVVFANQYSAVSCRHDTGRFGLTCRPRILVPDSAGTSGIYQHDVFFDLDADGVPDVVGAGGVVTPEPTGSVGAGGFLVDAQGGEALEWSAGGSARLDPTVQRVSWSKVDQYRDGPAPDLIILDNGSPEARPNRLIAYPDLVVGDGTIGTEAPLRCHEFAAADGDLRSLVEGDFDGDGRRELRALTVDGYPLAVDPSAPFEECRDLTGL